LLISAQKRNMEMKEALKKYQKESKLREKEYLKKEKVKEKKRRKKLQKMFDKIIKGRKLTDSQMESFEEIYKKLIKEIY